MAKWCHLKNWMTLKVLSTKWCAFLSHRYFAQNKATWLSCSTKFHKVQLTHLPWTKWLTFRRRYFQEHFNEWKVLDFDNNFTEVCSWWSNWQYSSIGLDNGLAPNGRQATNDDPIHWRIYAALGGNRLNSSQPCHRWSIEVMNGSLFSKRQCVLKPEHSYNLITLNE